MCIRDSACAVLFFEKINIAFAVLILLKLTVDTVFTILKSASSLENRVNIFLRNNKSRGLDVYKRQTLAIQVIIS